MRRRTRVVNIGSIAVGGRNKIAVQSMCNTKTSDIVGTLAQIERLEVAGCEIVRVGVPDIESAKALKELKENIGIPLVADIHFDYKLALASVKHADKIRINPGNIGKHTPEVIKAAKDRGIAVRIGVNGGSVEKKFAHLPLSEALVESTLKHVELAEKLDFRDIILSLKATDVATTIKANQEMAKLVDYPLHIGITEAGTSYSGTIYSAVGIGSLLSQGIGDTIRVSLTADPVEEVQTGFEILKSLKLRKGKRIISCPTCSRACYDVITIAKEVEKLTKDLKKDITIAVMGCAVNGPGEAREADVGIAGSHNEAIIFKKGKVIKKVKEENIIEELMREIQKC